MAVSGYLHVHVGLLWGNIHGYPLNRAPVPVSMLETRGKSFVITEKSNHDSSVALPIAWTLYR